LDLKQHALSLLRQRIAGSESAQLEEAVAALGSELEEARSAAAAAKQKKADMAAAAKVGMLLSLNQ
jgi:diaminopimelate decarboxylase